MSDDLDLAAVRAFRAVVRALQERDLLPSQPGMTAGEAGRAAGAELPALAGELAAGAALFDAVTYGGRAAGAGDDAALRALDAAVARARPAAVTAGAA